MASFITLIFFGGFVAFNYFVFRVRGQHQCSTAGIGGLAGCECSFLGACDAQGTQRDGLNIADHLPTGLEQFGHLSQASQRNLAHLCEGHTIAILYDCNSRIPLYAATVIYENQFSVKDGGRPSSASFRPSRSGLQRDFQQSNADYYQSSRRRICYKARTDGNKDIIDEDWYQAKFLTRKRPRTDECIAGSDFLKVQLHKGHMIASNYGRGNQAKKIATFVYTNVVPQFGEFNSGPWKTFEGRLIRWGQDYCAKNGAARRKVQMFIVVGAIPSTYYGPTKTRFFGRNGFSDYEDQGYRVNVPAWMWTASCCTFEYKDDGGTWRTDTKSTAFWRENVPGTSECNRIDVDSLVRKLNGLGRSGTVINLFPYSNECNKLANYVSLP